MAIELTDGMKALVRTGRSGRTGIEWTAPFEVELKVDYDPKGKLCGLCLKGVEFAEFDPRYHCEAENLYIAEDYALEVIGSAQ